MSSLDLSEDPENSDLPNLPPSDDESIMNPTLDDAKPSTSLQDPDQCSLSAGRTKLSSSSLPPPSNHSSTESPDKSKSPYIFNNLC
ncbi:hypothetical protein GEMRC1_013188 [Eukaryota sp. GEM-RC1]